MADDEAYLQSLNASVCAGSIHGCRIVSAAPILFLRRRPTESWTDIPKMPAACTITAASERGDLT